MADKKMYALFKTNRGEFTVELFPDKAPITVANFKKLADSKFYDGTIFHRIIADFMIQGGDPQGTGYAGPNTGSSQFFVTVVPTPWLQNHHSIFGKVVENYDVVEAISKTATDFRDKPLEDVVLDTIEIVEK